MEISNIKNIIFGYVLFWSLMKHWPVSHSLRVVSKWLLTKASCRYAQYWKDLADLHINGICGRRQTLGTENLNAGNALRMFLSSVM